jgi:hypothetical protein
MLQKFTQKNVSHIRVHIKSTRLRNTYCFIEKVKYVTNYYFNELNAVHESNNVSLVTMSMYKNEWNTY